MTDKVEKIREKVVEMVNSINPFIPDEDGKNSDYEAGKLDAATQILQIIDSFEEPVSEDLEEAAHEYADLRMSNYEAAFYAFMSGAQWQQEKDAILPKVWNRENLDDFSYQTAYDLSNDWAKETPTWHDVEMACKLGANWQKEQMMKDAVDGWVFRDIKGGELRISDNKDCWNGIRIPEKSIEKSYLFCTTDDAIKVKLVIVKED